MAAAEPRRPLSLSRWRAAAPDGAAIWDLGFYAIREVAFFEVHNSNLSKLGPDGKPILNEAGRVVKGPNYRKPDLKKVWEEHCERAAA